MTRKKAKAKSPAKKKRPAKKKTQKSPPKPSRDRTKKKQTAKPPAPPPPPPPEKGKATGPKGINRDEVKNYYITALRKQSLRKVAKHFSLSESTVKEWSRKEKWPSQRDEFWLEEAREFREIVKSKTLGVKLQNLDTVRRIKRLLAQKQEDYLKVVPFVEFKAMDLERLVKLELSLMGEADITVENRQDKEAVKEALMEALGGKKPKLTRKDLRDAVRRAGSGGG